MSNRPFKKHQFLQSQAPHNGLFQDLHSAYICMKKLQEKSSSAYLSFGHLIKKVIEFHFYHINEVTGEQLQIFFCMWQMSDLRHGLNVKKGKPMFLPGTPRPWFASAGKCRKYQPYCSSTCSLPTPEHTKRSTSFLSAISTGEWENTSQGKSWDRRVLAMHD